MTKRTMGLFAAALLMGGCASDSSLRYWESPLPAESFVTGSKLPVSENYENYRGTKSISRPDYLQYRREGPRSGDM